MNYMLVFGSLRQKSPKGYNFNRFGGQVFIKDVELDGFEMYSLGAYPAICVGNGSIKCELHTVSDSAFANIRHMEKGAGYEEKIINLENGIKATLFIMDKKQLLHYDCPRVKSGDWV